MFKLASALLLANASANQVEKAKSSINHLTKEQQLQFVTGFMNEMNVGFNPEALAVCIYEETGALIALDILVQMVEGFIKDHIP